MAGVVDGMVSPVAGVVVVIVAALLGCIVCVGCGCCVVSDVELCGSVEVESVEKLCTLLLGTRCTVVRCALACR